MTAKELKIILDLHISSLTIVPGHSDNGFYILVTPQHYHKAKYSCTTDEIDFKFESGQVSYKGFILSTTKGIYPYKAPC